MKNGRKSVGRRELKVKGKPKMKRVAMTRTDAAWIAGIALACIPMIVSAGDVAAQAGRTVLPSPPAPAVTLYVATTGDDANPGTKERPFASIERAQREIRNFRRGGLPKGGIAVRVGGGQYSVARTFKLGRDDSGTADAPIVYSAAEGETPVFTGGVRLSGFQRVRDPAIMARLPDAGRDKVFQVDLKANGIREFKPLRLGGFAGGLGFKTHPTSELFFNGQAMQLARWPNDGYIRVAEVSAQDGANTPSQPGRQTCRITCDSDQLRRWKDDKDILLYGYWFHDWADSYERVASVDAEKREITLEPPLSRYGYRKGQRFYAVNLLSEIDSPGEWYLDRTSGTLFFYPPSDPAKAIVEVSVVEAPFVEFDNVSHITLRGLRWTLGAGDAVHINAGESCLLAGCTIYRFAGDGVVINGGTNHGVLSCDIRSMGRGGASVSGGDRKTLAPGGHFVENCRIHDLSRIDHTYTPAVSMSGAGNRIAHNLLHDIRSSAIRLGGNDHVVEFNEVFRAVTESDDQGGADMWGDPTFRGNVYRYNYWHHIGNWRQPEKGPPCGQAGIRLDDAICGVTICGNVFYRCSAGKHGFGGVQIHGGKDNLVENNVFADCMAAVSFSPWTQDRWLKFIAKSLDAPEIDKQLYLRRYPDLARLAEGCNANTIAKNVVFGCGQFLRNERKGVNRMADNVVSADDPGFADAARGDFALKPDATVLKSGFKPIPFRQIGLYLDEYRGQLPEQAIREARADNVRLHYGK